MKKTIVAFTTLGMVAGLVACGQPTYPEIEPLKGEKIADFSLGESEEIYASNGWSNGQPFNAVWTKENVTYSNGQMHLGITEGEAKDGEVSYPYTAGEARSHHLYGYGDFEVRMKPTAVVGSVSTFFVYTGQWDHIDGVANKHDEIDIEFLGKDTTKVQFNYFVNGQGGHEYMYDLGFDASKEFHNYGFRWEKDTITWVVDGKTAYQVKKDAKNPDLPSAGGHIMTNYWPSSASGWSGTFKGATSDTVDYEWIKTSAEGVYSDEEKPVEPVTPVDPEFDWDDVDETDLTFTTGSSYYEISKDEGVTTVAYSGAKDWANVVADIATVAKNNDTVNITLKNNSTAKSTIRVDVQGSNTVGNTDCLNTGAIAEGHNEIYTDMQWGGSKFDLAAGEEVEFIISYDTKTEKGAPKSLLIFIDSLQGDLVEHEGGSISISNVRFAKLSEDEGGEQGGEEGGEQGGEQGGEEGGEQGGEEGGEQGDAIALSFTSDVYTMNPTSGETESLNVTYTDLAGNSYATVSAGLPTLETTVNTFSVNIKNEGQTMSKVRVDILGQTQVGETRAINTAAKATGHTEIYTDTTYGGSVIEVAGGEEVVFVVTFDQSTDRGTAEVLNFFFDSCTWDDSTTHSGNLTISNFIFA